jgi:hypothetical protein
VPLDPTDYASALDRAAAHARSWLTTLPDRPVPFQADADAIRALLGESLPEDPADPAEVVDTLARAVEPGCSPSRPVASTAGSWAARFRQHSPRIG